MWTVEWRSLFKHRFYVICDLIVLNLICSTDSVDKWSPLIGIKGSVSHVVILELLHSPTSFLHHDYCLFFQTAFFSSFFSTAVSFAFVQAIRGSAGISSPRFAIVSQNKPSVEIS